MRTATGHRAGLGGCLAAGAGRTRAFDGKTRLSRNSISQVSDFKLKAGLGIAGPPGSCGVRSSEDVMASIGFQNLERSPGQGGVTSRMYPLHPVRRFFCGDGVRSWAREGREGRTKKGNG